MALPRILRWVIIGVVVLLVLAGAFTAYAFATDYGLEATVKKRDCTNPFKVTVETKSLGIDHTLDVTKDQCGLIQEGNFVVYHLRTQRTIIYEREGGSCIYDSGAPAACTPNMFL